mgnify:CR=1 FL=1
MLGKAADAGDAAVRAPRAIEFTFAILGFVVIAIALPVVLLAGGSFNGWLLGAGLFTFSWVIQIGIMKVAQGLDPTMAVGLVGLSSIGRAVIVVLMLFLFAGKVDRVMGLIGAGVFAAAFTFDLMGRSVLHAIRQKEKKVGGRA